MPSHLHQQQPYEQHQYPPPHRYGSRRIRVWRHGFVRAATTPGVSDETKPFFLTSESSGPCCDPRIAITASASDAFGAWRAWILITAIVVGYMVGRGIAKSGTRSHSSDPRETRPELGSRLGHES